MNRKERRAMEAMDRKSQKAGLNTLLDRLVLRKMRAFHDGNDDLFEEDLFDLIVLEGFDDAVDRCVEHFVAGHQSFDLSGFKHALLDEATSYIFDDTTDGADYDPDVAMFHGELFAVPVSGMVSTLHDAWRKGSIAAAIEKTCIDGSIVDLSSTIVVVPVLLDLVTASELMPGALAQLVKLVTDAAHHGLDIDETQVRKLLGLTDGDVVKNRAAFGGRLALGIQIQELIDDDDFPSTIVTMDQEKLIRGWSENAEKHFMDGVFAQPPSDYVTAATHLGLSRIETMLRSEAKSMGLRSDQVFDEVRLYFAEEVVWVSAIFNGIEFGPVDCPKLLTTLDFDEFHGYLVDIAQSVVVDEKPPIGRGTTV